MTLTIKRAEELAWSEERIFSALKARYDQREWVVLQQVRNTTGYDRSERYADAVALNCWKSRGMELHGFEFKSSRSDLLSELRNPEKAESGIYTYCDRWWLVIGHLTLIKKGELPATWGLMAPKKGVLTVHTQAPKLEPKTLDRGFIASVLRAAQHQTLPESQLVKSFKEGKEVGYKEGVKRAPMHSRVESYNEKQFRKLLQEQQAFKKAAGIEYSAYDMGQIGELVKFLKGNGMDPHVLITRCKGLLENWIQMAQRHVKEMEEAAKQAARLKRQTAEQLPTRKSQKSRASARTSR
jgi:hypothetical protein